MNVADIPDLEQGNKPIDNLQVGTPTVTALLDRYLVISIQIDLFAIQ